MAILPATIQVDRIPCRGRRGRRIKTILVISHVQSCTCNNRSAQLGFAFPCDRRALGLPIRASVREWDE